VRVGRRQADVTHNLGVHDLADHILRAASVGSAWSEHRQTRPGASCPASETARAVQTG
jgi:hypothetical protein